MATKKPTAPAKTTKPAAKSAPAKSAPAKKAAPAPAPAPVEEEAQLEAGMFIRFLGYGEDVSEDQQVLVEGEVYEIADFTEAEGDDPGGLPLVKVDNPDFNEKKKESDDNPKQILIDVMPEEFEVVDESDLEGEGEEGAEEGEEAAAEEEAPAPAPAPAKGKGKAAAAPAPAPAKGKAVGKAKTAPAPAAEEAAEEEDTDTPDLENEDEEVVALVSENEGRLIDVAQELESQNAVNEYRLGGILYHIKKSKAYLDVENGVELYGPEVNKGWAKFIGDYFNLEYRKAMHLIKIYVAFSLTGLGAEAAATVASMGWSKAAKIAPLMIETPDSANDLIELANEHTVIELSEAIQTQATVGGKSSGGQRVTKTTLKFKLVEEEGKVVTTVLEATMQQNGMKDLGDALVHIISDWATNNGVELPAKAEAAPKQTKAVGKGKAAPAAKSAPAKRVAAKAAA